jgi:hypothetical protein
LSPTGNLQAEDWEIPSGDGNLDELERVFAIEVALEEASQALYRIAAEI